MIGAYIYHYMNENIKFFCYLFTFIMYFYTYNILKTAAELAKSKNNIVV